MADGSHIEWTEASWNFITGCTKISEGCLRCYIERTPPFRMQHRTFDKPGIGGTTGVTLHSDRLSLPTKWRKPRRIFVNSLADIFHEEVPDQFIADAFAVMALAPQHSYQILTKRHARMRALLSSVEFRRAVGSAIMRCGGYHAAWRYEDSYAVPAEWPLSSVWLGVSVESQQWADARIPALLDTPAAVRWLSCEPLVGPVHLDNWLYLTGSSTGGPWFDGRGRRRFVDGLGRRLPSGVGGMTISFIPALDLRWVVVGGESGPGARPMHPKWPRLLRDQCVAADVPYFYKQTGEWASIDDAEPDGWRKRREDWHVRHDGYHWPLTEPHGAEDGTEVLIRRVGKKAAGRLLDGRTWDEYPRTVEAVPHAA